MITISRFFLFLLPFIANAQIIVQGTILDKEDNRPIEFVDIYNGKDYTYSNENGKFIIKSNGDNATFQVLGYKELTLALNTLRQNDTIYLEPNVYQLDEVIVSNSTPPVVNMFKAINKNYPIEAFQEQFFLRNVLKRMTTYKSFRTFMVWSKGKFF